MGYFYSSAPLTRYRRDEDDDLIEPEQCCSDGEITDQACGEDAESKIGKCWHVYQLLFNLDTGCVIFVTDENSPANEKCDEKMNEKDWCADPDIISALAGKIQQFVPQVTIVTYYRYYH